MELNIELMEGDDWQWEKVIQCLNPHCLQMFLAKRISSKYCSVGCKDVFNNQRRLQSGYFKQRRANIRIRRIDREINI